MGTSDDSKKPLIGGGGAFEQLALGAAVAVDMNPTVRGRRHQLLLSLVTLAMTTALLARLTSSVR